MTNAIMPTYGRMDVAFTKGEGAWLTDENGKRYLTFRYPNGKLLHHNKPGQRNLHVIGDGEKQAAKPVPVYKGQGGIEGDFIHCVKTREKPFRDIEYAINTVMVAHMGIVAYSVERSLKWDRAKQQFVNDAEANRFLDRARREPWQI